MTLWLCLIISNADLSGEAVLSAQVMYGDDPESQLVYGTLTRDWLQTNAELTIEQRRQCQAWRYRISEVKRHVHFTLHHYSEIDDRPLYRKPLYRIGQYDEWRELPVDACRDPDKLLSLFEILQHNWNLPRKLREHIAFVDHLRAMESKRRGRVYAHIGKITNRHYPMGWDWSKELNGWMDGLTGDFVGHLAPHFGQPRDYFKSYMSLPGFPHPPQAIEEMD